MPLGNFERKVLAVIAAHRNPDSYVAGATVLNQSAGSARISRDIDIFHEVEAALEKAVSEDCAALEAAGFAVEVNRALPGLVRAMVRQGPNRTKLEWVFDSTFRFFPVEPDEELGYRLNFWDAATNKVLAAAGRAEIRDYVDLLALHRGHLCLGALVWAAAGKDAGLSPAFILGELSRVQRYPAEAYASLLLAEPANPSALKTTWLSALREAGELFDQVLGKAPLGCLFLDPAGIPRCPTRESLPSLKPHFGSVRGSLPRIAAEPRH